MDVRLLIKPCDENSKFVLLDFHMKPYTILDMLHFNVEQFTNW